MPSMAPPYTNFLGGPVFWGQVTYGLVCSKSKKGDCYDNAQMESFWGLLKNELVHQKWVHFCGLWLRCLKIEE